MAPIRIALIGLSASAITSWAAEGHLPYLLSPRGRRHYAIVALLNSSVNAAEAARAHFDLPGNVKTYGDPELLAQDPDVDLVICCTRVDTHATLTTPSVRAGKAVFVEWPLTENLHSAEELAALAAEAGGDAIVGVQGRVTNVVLRIKEVVESGRIGKVLGSDVEAYGNLWGRDEFPTGLAYFTERKVGGNPVTIAFAHMVDFVHYVLGEFEEGWESRMQIQRPQVKVGEGPVRSDVPDFVAVHGALKGRNAVEGATLAVRFRTWSPFKGRTKMMWRILGEKGEVEVESPAGPYLHSDSYEKAIKIRVHDHESDMVEVVEWAWEGWQEELPVRARNVGQVYERYAAWVENGKRAGEENWPGIGNGLLRMRELDTLFKRFDKQSI